MYVTNILYMSANMVTSCLQVCITNMYCPQVFYELIVYNLN